MPDNTSNLSIAVDNNPMMTVDKLIQDYVALRDKKKLLQEQHARELAPFNAMMSRVEAYLLESLNRAGVESMRGQHGTAYKSVRTSAVVREWGETLPYILEHRLYHLLEARVAKNAAFDVIRETGEPIPGVETSSEVCVNVRRAGEKPAASSNNGNKE